MNTTRTRGGLRGVAESNFATNAVSITIGRPREIGTTVTQLVDAQKGVLADVEMKHSDPMPEPSLVIPADWVPLIVELLSEMQPPDLAQARHLDDAIAVRDRLLALVEGGRS